MAEATALPVKVRLMGRREDVAILADRLAADPTMTVIERSDPYPNRRGNPGQVRVYLEVLAIRPTAAPEC